MATYSPNTVIWVSIRVQPIKSNSVLVHHLGGDVQEVGGHLGAMLAKNQADAVCLTVGVWFDGLGPLEVEFGRDVILVGYQTSHQLYAVHGYLRDTIVEVCRKDWQSVPSRVDGAKEWPVPNLGASLN